jgi:hypothetical protein
MTESLRSRPFNEFCNKIGPSLHELAWEIASVFGGGPEVVDDTRQLAERAERIFAGP